MMDPTFDQYVTPELKADPVAWPILEKMQEKSVTDVLKSYAHSEHRLGSSLPVKLNGDITDEDRAKFNTEYLPKLIEAKYLPAPVKLPDKYEIARPQGLPEGAWSEALEGKVHTWAKKFGLTQEAVNEGLGIHLETFAGFGQAIVRDREAARASIKEQAEKKGWTYDQVMESLTRWSDTKITDPVVREKMRDAGWADDPDLAMVIHEAVMASGESVRNLGGATMADEQKDALVNEAKDITGNKQNTKYQLYHSGDRATMEYVDNLWKKAHGSVEIDPNTVLKPNAA
jgi:hypothetical protein